MPLRDRWLSLGIPLLLVLATWAVFGQTLAHDFVNYDDDADVYENAFVIKGLTAKGCVAAFTQTDVQLWTPLTRLSHMLDCQLFGLEPWGHHLTNVLLHTASALLLFLALRRMTAALWPSALVAAAFAVHPLHVESVAWIAERKDALSGFFFFLTLLAYVGYVRNGRSARRYVIVAILFALGLLAKPMLVTMPFLLLLLDYWPLRRVANCSLRPANWRPLIVEKLPLLALTGLILWLILSDPFAWNGPKAETVPLPLSLRLSNSVVSYSVYIWKMFYPVDLSVRYPYPIGGVPMAHVVLSILFLIAISVAVYLARRSRPYLLVGWLWYVGMLVPVSQAVQLGSEALCDRYTYLPQIGLYIALVWGGAELLRSSRFGRVVGAVTAAAIVAAMMAVAHVQAAYWKDSLTLWSHAAACAPGDWITQNCLGFALASRDPLSEEALQHYYESLRLRPGFPDALNNLGLAMAARGKLDEAKLAYEQTLRVRPDDAFAHNNLGIALAKTGHLPEAVDHLAKALRIKGYYPEAHDNLGLVLVMQGRLDEAIKHYQLALQDKPNLAQAHNNLAMAIARKGDVSTAQRHLEDALRLRPDYAAAHVNLGMLLTAQGRVTEAITHYEAACASDPKSSAPFNNLAWLLATYPAELVRNGPRAVELAGQADRLAGGRDPMILDTLAAAYAEAGDYEKAVETATRAIELAKSMENNDLTEQLSQRCELYRRRQPFRHS